MTRGVAWNTVGTLFNQGSTFLVNIVVAHLLAPGVFGRYALIQTTLAVVASIAQLSSGYTAARYVAELRDRDPDRAGRVLALCGAVAIVSGALAALALLGGSSRVAIAVNDPGLSAGLRIAAAAVFFTVTNGFLSGALGGLERYSALGKAWIASGIAYVLLCAAGTWLRGLDGALAGIVLSAICQGVLLWTLVVREARRSRIRVRPSEAWREARVFAGFSLPAALNGFVLLPAIWTANAMLARHQGFEQVALFTAANSFRIIVLFVPNILNTVGTSILNNHRGAGDEVQFRRLFWTNFLAAVATIAIGGAVVGVGGRTLLTLFGHQFAPAYPALIVLMVAALAETLSLAALQIIQARETIWLSFVGIALPRAAALVASAAFLTSANGAFGLAWAYAASEILAVISSWAIVSRLGIWSAPEDAAFLPRLTAKDAIDA